MMTKSGKGNRKPRYFLSLEILIYEKEELKCASKHLFWASYAKTWLEPVRAGILGVQQKCRSFFLGEVYRAASPFSVYNNLNALYIEQ